MKNIILCLFILLSGDVHAEGKWRERFYRFLPFIAPKTYKLEKLEQEKKSQMKQRVTSMDDLSLMVLDLDLRNDTHNIETIKEMAVLAKKEVLRRIDKDEQAEFLEMLAPLLKARLSSVLHDPVTAPHFFEIFLDAARDNLPEKYRSILQEFLSANLEAIMALGPTPKQFKELIRIGHSTDASIKILQKVLDGGDVDEFFTIFDAIAIPSPSSEYQDALGNFFIGNTEKIGELPFSHQQIKLINKYIKRVDVGIMLLETGLKQARGNAEQFFAAFNAIAIPSPSEDYQLALSKFFSQNTEAIKELSLSSKQVKHIAEYIKRISTSIKFLNTELKQAGRNADNFFAIFNAVTDFNPSEDYQDALDKFFIQNADRIKEFAFSTKQVEHIGDYINKEPTLIVLLEGGLEHAGGDADKFFALFRAISYAPDESYRDALNTFFIDNAKKIMNLGLSVDQIEYLNHKINRYSTSIKILELALEKAKHAGDFFNIFFVIAPNSPKGKAKHIYGDFLTNHARSILDLKPSLDQMHDLVVGYIPSASAFFDTAEAQKRQRKKRRKNKDACSNDVVTLLSLGHLSKSTK